jgi:hypothetical protein
MATIASELLQQHIETLVDDAVAWEKQRGSRDCSGWIMKGRFDAGRFAKALLRIVGKGFRYAKLIGGEGIHRPETWQTA